PQRVDLAPPAGQGGPGGELPAVAPGRGDPQGPAQPQQPARRVALLAQSQPPVQGQAGEELLGLASVVLGLVQRRRRLDLRAAARGRGAAAASGGGPASPPAGAPSPPPAGAASPRAAAGAGWRRPQRPARAAGPTRRARPGWPARNRRRSSAIPPAAW